MQKFSVKYLQTEFNDKDKKYEVQIEKKNIKINEKEKRHVLKSNVISKDKFIVFIKQNQSAMKENNKNLNEDIEMHKSK